MINTDFITLSANLYSFRTVAQLGGTHSHPAAVESVRCVVENIPDELLSSSSDLSIPETDVNGVSQRRAQGVEVRC